MTLTQLGDFSTMLQVQFQRPQMCDEQIGLLRAAMDRIATGTYGRCIRCHGEIGMVRLTALPHASFCIGCQEDAFYYRDSGDLGSRTLLGGRRY